MMSFVDSVLPAPEAISAHVDQSEMHKQTAFPTDDNALVHVVLSH